MWLSREAKETWRYPIGRISQFIQELEVLSVVKDHRKCTWQTIAEETLPKCAERWGEMGLVTLSVRRVGKWQGFAHKHIEVKPGESANVCVILSKSMDDAKKYAATHDRGDNDEQGHWLGFPKCCREFFCDIWPKGYYDPIWQVAQAKATSVVSNEGRKIRVKGHPHSNPVLRYIGLRTCFHIPCSFNCKDTIEISEQRLELARETNPELTKTLETLFSMPMSWDCLKGIAVIRTPIFYVITSSVACKYKHVVEIEGECIPKGAKKGTCYPFDKA